MNVPLPRCRGVRYREPAYAAGGRDGRLAAAPKFCGLRAPTAESSVLPPYLVAGRQSGCGAAAAVRLGHVYQAWIGRAGDTSRVVCAGLSKQIGTTNPAHDRQHPGSCGHCPLH